MSLRLSDSSSVTTFDARDRHVQKGTRISRQSRVSCQSALRRAISSRGGLMATTVFTGWRKVTPGNCLSCGFDDGWHCDGRGTIRCDRQACPDCGSVVSVAAKRYASLARHGEPDRHQWMAAKRGQMPAGTLPYFERWLSKAKKSRSGQPSVNQ